MIIALFALAFAMIVGGLFAAILGWDIVLVERGWTMVISGSISAASGALLLGVTAIVSKLSRIEAELMRLQTNLVEEEADEAGALPAAAGMSLAALEGGMLGRKTPDTAAASIGREDREPAPPLFAGEADGGPAPETSRPADTGEIEEIPPKPRVGFGFRRPPEPEAGPSKPAEPETAPAEEEMKVPEFLFAERIRETSYTEVRTPEPEREEVAKEPERTPFDRAEEKPEIETETETETETEAASEEATAEEPQEVSVIGTYNSGDNKYVMYSDGSIEAETPEGMFRFKSLDELKEFIATGEGGTRIT